MNYVLLALSWIVFYILYTVVVASKLKRIWEEKSRNAYKWYRLVLTLILLILFFGITIQALLIPKIILIPKSDLTNYLVYMLAGLGAIIATKASKKFSLKRFMGFGRRKNEDIDLITTGLYSKIRHPFYAAMLLIFLGYFLFSGSLSAAIHLGLLLLYLPIGIYFEEKNLAVEFGEAYQEYKNSVPAIIPMVR